MAEAAERDRAATDAEARAAAEAKAAKEAKAQLERERAWQRANDAALAARENRIALAGILFVIGALGAGAGLLFHSQKKPREAKIAGGGGAALILVAAILFLTRPDAHADVSDLGDDVAPAAGTGTSTL